MQLKFLNLTLDEYRYHLDVFSLKQKATYTGPFELTD